MLLLLEGDRHLQIEQQFQTHLLNRWSIEVTLKSADETVSGDAQPDVEIPDADPAGVSSTISIAPDGTVEEVKVHVEIAHTYIGDLHVELVAPSGQSAMLHNQTGRFADDLRITYDHTLAPALDALVGESVQGDWTLRVRDLEQWDKGRLESWSLGLRYSP